MRNGRRSPPPSWTGPASPRPATISLSAGWRSGTPRITSTWSGPWPGKTRSARRSGTTTSGSGRHARTRNACSACVPPPQRTAPPPGGPPGLSQSRRSGAAGGSRLAPGSAARSAPPPPERAPSTSSSPAWPRPEFWSAAGTAPSTPGRVTGYAVGLPQHAGKDGHPIWYGGGKLAADLTLPKLRTRWTGPQAHDPLAGADQFPRAGVRAVLRATVAQAAEHATNEAEFFTRLRASGLLVRERFSEVNPGEVTGYAVTLPGCTGPDGTPRWFGAGHLHAALTRPRLRQSWARGYGGAERSGATRFTGPERTEIYRHAARQAATAAEHLRHCTATDPAQGADTLGLWPTRSTRPPGRPAAGHCAVLRTPTTGPPAHRTVGLRATLRRESSFGPRHGCSR